VADTMSVLWDIEEIKQLKARYFRLVDTKDWDAWRDLLTVDYRLESDAGVYEGRDAVFSMVSSALAEGSTVHHALAPEIALTGPATATGVWAYQDHVVLTLDGQTIAFHGYGHCHEEYARTEDGWRVRSTVETRLRVDPVEISEAAQ
jgi:hypothetical protein